MNIGTFSALMAYFGLDTLVYKIGNAFTFKSTKIITGLNAAAKLENSAPITFGAAVIAQPNSQVDSILSICKGNTGVLNGATSTSSGLAFKGVELYGPEALVVDGGSLSGGDASGSDDYGCLVVDGANGLNGFASPLQLRVNPTNFSDPALSRFIFQTISRYVLSTGNRSITAMNYSSVDSSLIVTTSAAHSLVEGNVVALPSGNTGGIASNSNGTWVVKNVPSATTFVVYTWLNTIEGKGVTASETYGVVKSFVAYEGLTNSIDVEGRFRVHPQNTSPDINTTGVFPQVGTFYYANGTTWNPGGGEALYITDSSKKLRPVGRVGTQSYADSATISLNVSSAHTHIVGPIAGNRTIQITSGNAYLGQSIHILIQSDATARTPVFSTSAGQFKVNIGSASTANSKALVNAVWDGTHWVPDRSTLTWV